MIMTVRPKSLPHSVILTHVFCTMFAKGAADGEHHFLHWGGGRASCRQIPKFATSCSHDRQQVSPGFFSYLFIFCF